MLGSWRSSLPIEGRWRECRECLPEVIPAVQHLWEKRDSSRAASLTYRGFATGQRIGELEIALRILQQEEALCLELGNKDSLQRSYGNQALVLQAWGRLEQAFALHKKEEALCLELGNKNGLQRSYGNQAGILQAGGQLQEAMALLKKQEALCLELGNKDGLQTSYGNQAVILRAWGRLEEALALHEKQEAFCLELGYRRDLAYCYWQWGLLARKQRDRKTERERLAAAVDIFSELNMPLERDKVRAELGKTTGADGTS
jgi:tetratricopeptide (TPR) repeat protein